MQIVSLEDGARQVEFDTFVDWQERQTVLKALFPFDLNVSEIRSEIQFGHVKRATHRNTSWDRARFEASMHRWVDISEPDFGAALLNDCKYGYDAVEQLVRITLLRGATFPDPRRISASTASTTRCSCMTASATSRRCSSPPRASTTRSRWSARRGSATTAQSTAFSFATVDSDNVTLETVKQAEDGKGLILRVFEHANRRANATIRFGMPVASAELVNLMEDPVGPLEMRDNTVTLNLRPFEIATIRLSTA